MKILIETVENGFIVHENYLEIHEMPRHCVAGEIIKRKVFNTHRQLNSYINKNIKPNSELKDLDETINPGV